MKNLKDYIVEQCHISPDNRKNWYSSSQIRDIAFELEKKFDVDPIEHYIAMFDGIMDDDSVATKEKWIDDEIGQIVIDIRNVDKDPLDYTHNATWKEFMKLFKKEYKDAPNYELALQMYKKLEEYK